MQQCTADYVILPLECFPWIKALNQYCLKHKLTCFMLVTRDERKKNEVIFLADYVSVSFMDKNTKFEAYFSKP